MQKATGLFKLERRAVTHWSASPRLVLAFQEEAAIRDVLRNRTDD